MRSPFAIFTHSAVGIPLRGGAITILKVSACQRDWSQRSSKETAQAMPHADRLGAAPRQKARVDYRHRGAIRAEPPLRALPLTRASGAARVGAAASSAAVPASSHARKRAPSSAARIDNGRDSQRTAGSRRASPRPLRERTDRAQRDQVRARDLRGRTDPHPHACGARNTSPRTGEAQRPGKTGTCQRDARHRTAL